MNKLQEFIQGYLDDNNNMSRRALAEKMVVQHRTLNNYMNEDKSPTLYFLTRLSSATGYDLLTLVALVAPDNIHQVSADVMLLAQQIDKLPEPDRSIVIKLIKAALPKEPDNTHDENKVSKGNKGKRGSKK